MDEQLRRCDKSDHVCCVCCTVLTEPLPELRVSNAVTRHQQSN